MPPQNLTAIRAHHYATRTPIPPPFPPRFLDTARIIKEEPNSAQRRVPHTGPDLKPFGRRVGKRTMHPYTKRARTPLDPSDLRYIRSESIPYPGSNLSHFDGISWNQMPGGEGVPPGLVLTTPNRRLHPPLASPAFDISDSNRFRIPVRIKVLSQEYFRIKCRGEGCPPHWASNPVWCA